jgi:hypothetical protein
MPLWLPSAVCCPWFLQRPTRGHTTSNAHQQWPLTCCDPCRGKLHRVLCASTALLITGIAVTVVGQGSIDVATQPGEHGREPGAMA